MAPVPLPDYVPTPLVYLGLFAFTALWISHPFGWNWEFYLSEGYKKRAAKVHKKYGVMFFSPMALTLIWTIVYGLAAAATIVYWIQVSTMSVLAICTWSFLFITWVLIKLWAVLVTLPGAGVFNLANVVLAWAAAGTVDGLLWTQDSWWPAGLWSGVVIWMTYSIWSSYHLYRADKLVYAEERKERRERAGLAGRGK